MSATGDPASLGLEMKRLLDDHERRQDMGEAGRRAVEAKYSWKIISKQMLDLYTDILADRSALTNDALENSARSLGGSANVGVS